MKRIIAAFAACLLLCLYLTSCGALGSGSSTGSSTGSTTTTSCRHSWTAATCEEPKTCSKCGETTGAALGHTTSTGICTRCSKNFSAWELGEFVDEFKQPTGEKYIIAETYGTFSNSATTNSTLFAALQVTSDSIAIMLWEYGSSLVKGIFDSNPYSITVLDQSGTRHYFDGGMTDGGTRVYVYNSDEAEFLSLLKKSGTISIYLENNKYTTSTYLFSIDTNGFSTLYNEIS